MKTLYSLSFLLLCISISLISAHCTKERKIFSQSPCDSCGVSAGSTKGTLWIQDSTWERQATGLYQSDITRQLQDAGISVSQVYALYLIRDGNSYQIFPFRQVNYMSGVIFASIFSSGDNQACTIMYSSTDQESHNGEFPRGGYLPFSSITVQVLIMN